jgi:hypothetical protein
VAGLIGPDLGLHEEPSEKVDDRSVENLRLVQICRMPSVRNDDFLRAGDFGGDVARGREEGRIVGANDDERRNNDGREGIDDPRILLGQHAARSPREAIGCTMRRRRHLLA